MKIIHISDLHFGMHNPQITTHFLEIIKNNPVDAVIISGDLTQRAQIEQYEQMKAFLHSLPKNTLIVPGNHDISLYNPLARFLIPFKNYHHYIAKDTSSHLETADVRILGINSVNPLSFKDGKLSSESLEKLPQYFSASDDRLNILFFHHNFDYLEGLHKPLENEQEFLFYLKQSSIDIVCTGHLHYAHMGLIEKNNQKSCLVLHAGSLQCLRTKDGLNSYYYFETKQKQITIYWQIFEQNKFVTRSQTTIDFALEHAVLQSQTRPSPQV
jgi:3',5'-cyclic AMP phosphodiesterase CpdA